MIFVVVGEVETVVGEIEIVVVCGQMVAGAFRLKDSSYALPEQEVSLMATSRPE
jgi:hypothetical protein